MRAAATRRGVGGDYIASLNPATGEVIGTVPLSHDPAVDRALRNAYFAERGFEPIAEQWRARRPHIGAPVQLSLPLG